MQLRFEVDITKHATTLLCKLGHKFSHLIETFNSIPKQNITPLRDASISPLKKPCEIFIVLVDCPHKSWVVLFEVLEDVVGNVIEPAMLCDCKGSKMCDRKIIRRRENNSKSVHVLVEICFKVSLA